MKIFINDLVMEVIYESENRVLDRAIVPIEDLHSFATNYINHKKVYGKNTTFFLMAADKYQLVSTLKNDFKMIKAAGGVVRNDKNQILAIHRNNKWDIPKGKVEKGESTREASIREVEEECGIKHLKLHDKLLSTYHIYSLKGSLVLKKTNWYNMTCFVDQKLTPQKEEGIDKVKWVKPDFFKKPGLNTYKSLKEVINMISTT